MLNDSPPCRPWPSWPGSWGPVCSSRDEAVGGAGGLHRWWCCAPDVAGQTCGRIRRPPRKQTCLCPLLHGWKRCHTPAETGGGWKLFCTDKYQSILQSRQAQTSLSWAISWVFTCPDTRFTRPNTWPVSRPQIVQVVSMLDVPVG